MVKFIKDGKYKIKYRVKDTSSNSTQEHFESNTVLITGVPSKYVFEVDFTYVLF